MCAVYIHIDTVPTQYTTNLVTESGEPCCSYTMAFDGGDITVESDLTRWAVDPPHWFNLKLTADDNFRARAATEFINAAIFLLRISPHTHTLTHTQRS